MKRSYKPMVVGEVHSMLTAFKQITVGTKSRWLFSCDCGNEIEIRFNSVRSII